MAKNVQGNPGLVKQINGIYKFNIDGKIWIVDLKNAPGSVKEGTAADAADCTIMMKENDFVDMMSGTLDGQSAFMQGPYCIFYSIPVCYIDPYVYVRQIEVDW